MKTLAILLLSATVSFAALPEKFVRSVHLVETGGRFGAIKGDYDSKTKSYKALGPLQLQKSYFQDAKRFDKSLSVWQYEDCARYDVSVKVMNAYMKGYEPKAYKDNDFESLARLHNSGPSWRSKRSKTDGYWNKIKKNL